MIREFMGVMILLGTSLLLASCGDGADNPAVPARSNLTVSSITWDPPSPRSDEAVTVSVRVVNTGDADAAASLSRVEVNDAVMCATIATPTIGKGQSAAVACTLGGRAPGSYAIEACADVADVIEESNESDNCDSATLIVSAPAELPDLAIQEIVISPSDLTEGQEITVSVNVANPGDGAAPASKTRIQVDGQIYCAAIDTPAIPAGATAMVECNIGTRSAGAYVAQICVDITGVVTETTESNNCHTWNFTVTPVAPDPVDVGN